MWVYHPVTTRGNTVADSATQLTPSSRLIAPPSELLARTHLQQLRCRRKPQKVTMNNLTQPFVNLSAANAESITRFAQSPEMAELATTSAQKYFELAQKSFGRAPASGAQADLVRRLSENYATFAKEYSESLVGAAAEAQGQLVQHVKAATQQITKGTEGSVAAAAKASKALRPAK
jgi:hypothetical protein